MESSLQRHRLSFAATALVLLILFGRLPWTDQWALVLTNFAHGPVSALIAACIFCRLHGMGPGSDDRRTLARCWWLSVAITIFIGALIELTQSFLGRDAEIGDVMNDTIGAFAGAGLCLFLVQRRSPYDNVAWRRHAALMSTAVAMLAMVLPVAVMIKAYVERATRFPLLMDGNAFAGDFFLTPYWIKASRQRLPDTLRRPEGGSYGYRVQLGNNLSGGHPSWGVSLLELQSDWTSFEALYIDLANPTYDTLALQVRIIESPEGLGNNLGFTSQYTLQARSQARWRIPLISMTTSTGIHRMNLRRMYGMVISGDSTNRANEFFILRVGLERG